MAGEAAWRHQRVGERRTGPGLSSDDSSSASVDLDGELTPASYSRFASAYETHRADHPWVGDWGMTISDDTVNLPISGAHANNQLTRELLTLVVTDADVLQVRFEARYLSAVIVESADPVATRVHLAPVLGRLPGVRVISPGEGLSP